MMEEKVLDALEDFIPIAEQNNLNYSVAHVIDILRNGFSLYEEVMEYLYDQYGLNDE